MSLLIVSDLTNDELFALEKVSINKDILMEIAKRRDLEFWKDKLKEIIQDFRPLPIVLSGIQNKGYKYVRGSVTGYSSDCMGYERKSYRFRRKTQYEGGINLNNIFLTYKGWEEAKPIVQKALDFLDVEFVAGGTGLICKKGVFWYEKVYTDTDGYQFRMFDMDHGATGCACSCYPLFPRRTNNELNYVSTWSRILRLPESEDVVNVTNWNICHNCGKPIRPNELRIHNKDLKTNPDGVSARHPSW